MILALPLFCYPLACATAVADSRRRTLFVLLMMYGSAQHRLDPRRVSSKLTLAWRAKNMSGRMLSLQIGQANVLCLFHKIYG